MRSPLPFKIKEGNPYCLCVAGWLYVYNPLHTCIIIPYHPELQSENNRNDKHNTLKGLSPKVCAVL